MHMYTIFKLHLYLCKNKNQGHIEKMQLNLFTITVATSLVFKKKSHQQQPIGNGISI